MKRVVCLAVLVCGAAGFAQTYVYEFSGYISSIYLNENNVFPVALSDTFTGRFSFQDVPDQNVHPRRAEYNQNASISVALPNIALAFINQPARISIDDNFGGTAVYDNFHFNCDGYWYQNNYRFRNVWVEFNDWTDKTALNNTNLPPNLVISEFDYARLHLHGTSTVNDQSFQVLGRITEIRLVPEPATLLLLAAGGWALRKRRPLARR